MVPAMRATPAIRALVVGLTLVGTTLAASLAPSTARAASACTGPTTVGARIVMTACVGNGFYSGYQHLGWTVTTDFSQTTNKFYACEVHYLVDPPFQNVVWRNEFDCTNSSNLRNTHQDGRNATCTAGQTMRVHAWVVYRLLFSSRIDRTTQTITASFTCPAGTV
jgi:hypothetical protein